MDFARRLAALRREQHLTQQVLADRVGIHVSQLRREQNAVLAMIEGALLRYQARQIGLTQPAAS